MDKPKLINKIYTAGPIEGRNFSETHDWRDRTTKYLKKFGIECYNPGWDTTLNDPKTITTLDFMMIDNSEAILVNLDCLGEYKPTNTGTLIEIGYAKAKGKLIVGFSNLLWQRENRFLRDCVQPCFIIGADRPYQTARVTKPLQEALEYIAGFNNRRRK